LPTPNVPSSVPRTCRVSDMLQGQPQAERARYNLRLKDLLGPVTSVKKKKKKKKGQGGGLGPVDPAR